MSKAERTFSNAQHLHWQDAIKMEERMGGEDGQRNTWPDRAREYTEAKIKANPHLETYYAKGFPHGINNASPGMTDCMNATAPDFGAKSWQSETKHRSEDPFASPEPKMRGNVDPDACARIPGPVKKAHMDRLPWAKQIKMDRMGQQKTLPPEVPWVSPIPHGTPRSETTWKTGSRKRDVYTPQGHGGGLKHGRLTVHIKEAMRSGELQRKSLTRLSLLAFRKYYIADA